MLQAVNPIDGTVVAQYQEMDDSQVQHAIARAAEEQTSWRRTAFAGRARPLMQAAELLRRNAAEYAALMAQEMGKPLRDGKAESEKCAAALQFYAERSESMLSPREVPTEASRSYIAFEPLGVVLAVMPWNFPFWQVFRCAAPALMAGNTVLLKHASNVPGCAMAIERILREAGLPEGAFQTLLIGSRAVESVIAHPAVKAVSLTGSCPAGRSVAQQAGKHLKKCVLELGGSDAYVILDDADLDAAVEQCVKSRLINAGQSCIAAKRFIVIETVADAFTERFIERMKAVRAGDPCDGESDIGPMARRDLRDELHQQVMKTVRQGAVISLGGAVPEGPGAFYPPTVLTGVTQGMEAYEEELFGPVAAIIRAKNEKEAISIANSSRFGLGAAVFTRDKKRGQAIAEHELEAGCCFVNSFVRSDPRLPFGGIKESGYGRELADFGIMEFVNVKTVSIA